VTVTYTLKQRAIVTMNVETNAGNGVWAPISGVAMQQPVGDVCRVIEPGARSIVWSPTVGFPNVSVAGDSLRVGIRVWSLEVPPDYMVIDLEQDRFVRYYASEDEIPGGIGDRRYKTRYLVMRRIPAKGVTYWMGPEDTATAGSSTPATHASNQDFPRHKVAFTNDYYMAVYELTQGQYLAGLRKLASPTNPSAYSGDDRDVHPLESCTVNQIRGNVSTYRYPDPAVDANSFIGQLRAISGIETFDLPTEARWEFACRAGAGTQLWNGKSLDGIYSTPSANVDEIAWYRFNTRYFVDSVEMKNTKEVGTRGRNGWGLYDMLGNVCELCDDDWAEGPDWATDDNTTVVTNPVNRLSSDTRYAVRRAGSFTHQADTCRCAARSSIPRGEPSWNLGYRLMCEVDVR